MTGRGRLPIVAAGGLVAAFILIGCGFLAGLGEGDALNLGESPGSACVFRSESGRGTFGTTVANVSEETVEFRDVRLVDPSEMTLAGSAVVVLARGEDGLGAARGWPPRIDAPQGYWADRHPVRGFELGASDEVELWVGLQVTDTANTGTTQAVELEYRTADGDVRVQQTVDQLTVTERRSCR